MRWLHLISFGWLPLKYRHCLAVISSLTNTIKQKIRNSSSIDPHVWRAFLGHFCYVVYIVSSLLPPFFCKRFMIIRRGIDVCWTNNCCFRPYNFFASNDVFGSLNIFPKILSIHKWNEPTKHSNPKAPIAATDRTTGTTVCHAAVLMSLRRSFIDSYCSHPN